MKNPRIIQIRLTTLRANLTDVIKHLEEGADVEYHVSKRGEKIAIIRPYPDTDSEEPPDAV